MSAVKKDEPTTALERMVAIAGGTVIVVAALLIDGTTAQTMAIAVAGALFGVGGFALGKAKAK